MSKRTVAFKDLPEVAELVRIAPYCDHFEQDQLRCQIRLYGAVVGDGGRRKRYIVTGFVVEDADPRDPIPPTAIFALSPDMAQTLANDLWQAGVQPAQGKGSAGQLDAINKHLADMRRLVFELRKQTAPGDES